MPRAIGIVRAGGRPASGAPTRHAAHAARVLRRESAHPLDDELGVPTSHAHAKLTAQ